MLITVDAEFIYWPFQGLPVYERAAIGRPLKFLVNHILFRRARVSSPKSNCSLEHSDVDCGLVVNLCHTLDVSQGLQSISRGPVRSYTYSSLLPLRAPIQQVFSSVYLGNVAPIVVRSSKICELEDGLLVQSSYSGNGRHPKIDVARLSCRPSVLRRSNGKQSV